RGYSEVAPALLRLIADDLKLRGSPRNSPSFLRLIRSESPTIFAGRDANTSDERRAHMLFVVETATLSNGFDAASGLHQEASCRVHPDGLNGLGRSTASLGKVDASKVPRAHVNTASKSFAATVFREVLCDPQFNLFEYVVGGPDLSRQERAVLRLTA